MVSEDYIVIMGHNFPKSEIRLGGVIVCMVVASLVLLSSLYWGFFGYSVSKGVVDDQDVGNGLSVSEDLSPLEAVLSLHAKALSQADIFSYKASGNYYTNDVKMDMSVLSRRPNLYRQVLEHANVEIAYGYDGEDVWLHQSHPVVDLTHEELRLLNESLIQLENSIMFLAWAYEEHDFESWLTLFPDHHVGDKVYAVVRSYSLLPFPVFHYIDRDTGSESFRTADIPLGSGIRHIEIKYEYGPRHKTLPQAYSLYVNRELHGRAEFTRLDLNVGAPSFLFNPPVVN